MKLITFATEGNATCKISQQIRQVQFVFIILYLLGVTMEPFYPKEYAALICKDISYYEDAAEGSTIDDVVIGSWGLGSAQCSTTLPLKLHQTSFLRKNEKLR